MDERLAAAAEQSPVLRQLRGFTEWVGEGRKLTQTGRITLTDARVLVPMLGTGDVIDPEIGDRVFKTKSSEELSTLTAVMRWAKAARLVRLSKGRLLPVRKSAPLLSDPLRLWDRAFEVFPGLGEALCPAGWTEALLRREFKPAMTAVLSRLYGGVLPVAEACELGWEVASAPYAVHQGTPRQRETWRLCNDRDVVRALRVLRELGALRLSGVGLSGGDDATLDGTAELTELGLRGVRRMLGEPEPGEPVYQITVTLAEVADPPVWRRLLVSGHTRLDRLHRTVQAAMGWQDHHLHEFATETHRYGHPDLELELRDERRVALADLVRGEGTQIGYTYDFGDDWEHEILVEEVLAAAAGVRYPVCVAGQGACPPEDCGGPPGYDRLREVLADPEDPEHEDMVTWLGLGVAGEFDPMAFDVERVNGELARMR
ncbi:MAG: plasmid pRiA4b ORF-3 family protein [Pseudonocardiaceae bacterium]